MNRIGILLKLLLTSLIILTSVLAKSQEYHPMIGENKRWVIKESSNFSYQTGPDEIRYFFHFFDGDTIINNITYSKLYRQDFHFTNQYDSINNELQQAKLDFFVRDDIQPKRIYSLERFSHLENLRFDFSLVEGDTLLCTTGQRIPIVDIDTINLNDGSTRRIYHNEACFGGADPFWPPHFVIEGIGGEGGLYFHSPLLTGGIMNYELACYMEDSIELFGDCDYPDFVIVDADDIKPFLSKLQIYPNPSFDHTVIIHHADEPLQMYIRDINGILFKTTKIFPNIEERINTSDLKPGAYIIHLQGSKDNYTYQKLIINP